MFNPSVSTASKGSANKKAITEVTKWITDTITGRDLFELADFQVMVTEIQCNEPDCVPIETLVIIVLMDAGCDTVKTSKSAQKWAKKIMKPVAEVSKEDVVDLIAEIFPSNSPQVTSDINPLVERNSRIELFGTELSALISKYRNADPAEDAAAYELLLLEALQTQVDVLKRDMVKAEAPISILPIPTPEPVRAVTTVIMKPNVPKTAPAAAHVLQLPIPIATSIANPTSPPISVPMVNKFTVPQVPSPAVPSSSSSETVGNALSSAPASAAAPAAVVKMTATTSSTTVTTPVVTYSQPVPASGATIAPRHKKGGTRPRGCPCCDPDNLDNIIDSMMFSHYPQT